MRPYHLQRTFEEWQADFESQADPGQRYRALAALVQLADQGEILAPLAAGLGDTDSAVRALAARSLSRPPQREVLTRDLADWGPQLTAQLTDPDPDVRFEIARTLVHMTVASPAVGDVLRALLVDPETPPVMKGAVVEVLGATTAYLDWALAPVRILLLESIPEVRESAMTTIANWGPLAKAALPDVLPLIDDEEPIVREQAARALGQFGDWSDEVIEALTTATEDEDTAVAEMAAEALRSAPI